MSVVYNKGMMLPKDCCNPCDKCNKCKKPTCGNCCKGCEPARFDCDFDIQADPYNPEVWVLTMCGMSHRISVPDRGCLDASLTPNYTNSTLSLSGNGLCKTSILTGDQLGNLIKVDNLRDVDINYDLEGNCYEFIYHKDVECGIGCESPLDHWSNFNINSKNAKVTSVTYLRGAGDDGCPVYLDKPDSCSLLVFDPNCEGEDGWKAYTIPDADDCELEPDENGFYHILKKNDCGCPVECKLPIMPPGMATLNYQRDSVPDDPDFPWYYGNYNDRINLHLEDNAPQYFGKYDLKVTVNYGVQAIKSSHVAENYCWRSLVVPVVDGEAIQTTSAASILQNWGMASGANTSPTYDIPWGSTSLRGSFTFIVPKGKEAYLHHEYRVRTNTSFPNYYTGSWDGKRVPDSEAALDSVLHPASRLNALQVLIEPTQGSTSYDPVADPYRDQLDPPVDSYVEA